MIIISVGKDHDPIYKDALDHFEKRLKMYTKLSWSIIKPSGLEESDARKDESARIMKQIKPQDFVLLLDENGNNMKSIEIANLIEKCNVNSRAISVIIGGAYGVDESIKNRADCVLAFGKSAFPHQLMRVMVVEQMYRAYSILAGSLYHHE